MVGILTGERYRVELANGHRMVARVSGRARLAFERITTGDRVVMDVSPYDLSTGSIITVERV